MGFVIASKADDHIYECERCGWPVTLWSGTAKHVANGQLGASPCKGPAKRLVPRGSHTKALRGTMNSR